MKYLSLDRRRRLAYGFLTLMVVASIAELLWAYGLGRPVFGFLTWFPLLTVFPIISVIAVARETAALKASRRLSVPSRQAQRWLLGGALGLFVLSLALGLMLLQLSPAR